MLLGMCIYTCVRDNKPSVQNFLDVEVENCTVLNFPEYAMGWFPLRFGIGNDIYMYVHVFSCVYLLQRTGLDHFLVLVSLELLTKENIITHRGMLDPRLL